MGVSEKNIYKVSWTDGVGLVHSAYVVSVTMDCATTELTRNADIGWGQVFQVTLIAVGLEATPNVYWYFKDDYKGDA